MSALNQARILVTRPLHQSATLCALIVAHDGVPICLPTLAICPITLDEEDITRALNQSEAFIFTSANAVTLYCSQLDDAKMAQLRAMCCMAIGKATAQALNAKGVSVDFMPEQGYNSEALLALLALQEKIPQYINIIRGENGREILTQALSGWGVAVTHQAVYRREVPEVNCSDIVQYLSEKQLDILTATSGDAIQNLVTMLPHAQHNTLKQLPLVVISERIRNIAKRLGFQWIFVAQEPSDDAILEAATTLIHGKQHGRID